jgi:D-tyrosyl-tRNA(Tyr) deacylase
VRAVIQRVNRANVTSSGEIVGSIGLGLAVLLAVGRDDVPEDGRYIVDKTLNLRIFSDDAGRFARSLLDVNGELLLVSQFTLYGDTRKGRRPSFVKAAPPEIARESFTDVVERFRAAGLKVETGRFQAMMEVELVNAGPVTIIIDSADRSSLRY